MSTQSRADPKRSRLQALRGKVSALRTVGRRLKVMVPLFASQAGGLLRTPRESIRFFDHVIDFKNIWDDSPGMPTRKLQDWLPAGTEGLDSAQIRLVGRFHDVDNFTSTQSLRELAALALLVNALAPRRIFEFGTNTGRSARLYAENTPETTEVYTLDLPQDEVIHGLEIGREFLDSPVASRIHQIWCDSLAFDPEPYRDQMDYVWIDANHAYDFVRRDTENALVMARPGATVAWHDYKHSWDWSSVTRCVHELAPRFTDVTHLWGTTCVVARVPGGR